VERVLLEHPSVAEVAVLGLPDRRLGERVVAAVVRHPAVTPAEVTHQSDASDGESLRAFCRERLARHKVPEAIAFVESMPRNAMSKIVKRALHEHFEEK
jgi:long-chain acyl-CoA synthetase